MVDRHDGSIEERKPGDGHFIVRHNHLIPSWHLQTTLLTLISTSAWGMMVQNATYAVTMPLYWLTHLFTSPTASETPSSSNLSISTADTVAILPSLLLGYFIPAFLQTLRAPTVVSTSTQQILMSIWQIFPIWCAVFQPLFKKLYTRYGGPDTPKSRLLALRTTYATTLAICAVAQISTMSVSITSKLFPSLFTPAAAAALAPSRVWNLNQPLFSAHTVANLGEGVLTFLQMDEVTGSIATLIWAGTMHWKATTAQKGGDVDWKYWAVMQAKILGSIAVGGPVAPAALLMWERDDMILAKRGEAEGKKEI
jgi:hypothetical protein